MSNKLHCDLCGCFECIDRNVKTYYYENGKTQINTADAKTEIQEDSIDICDVCKLKMMEKEYSFVAILENKYGKKE